jgi:adenosylcobinamide-phosphate synthase
MTLSRRWPSAAGLALGYLADRVVGDPRRGHPVAAFGAIATWLEKHSYADQQAAGLLHTGVLVGAAAGLGVLLERLSADRATATVLSTAAATWAFSVAGR